MKILSAVLKTSLKFLALAVIAAANSDENNDNDKKNTNFGDNLVMDKDGEVKFKNDPSVRYY